MTKLLFKDHTSHDYVSAWPFVKDAGSWKKADKVCIKIDGKWFCSFTAEYSCNLYHPAGNTQIKFDDGYIMNWFVDPVTNVPTLHKKFLPEFTKDVDQSFVPGDGNGSMLDAAPVPDHFINLWSVEGPGGEVDYVSQAAHDPTLPTGWTLIGYVGAIYRDATKVHNFETTVEYGRLKVLFNPYIPMHLYTGPRSSSPINTVAVNNRNFSQWFPKQLTHVDGSTVNWCTQTGQNKCTFYNAGSTFIDGHGVFDGLNEAIAEGRDIDFTKSRQTVRTQITGIFHHQPRINNWHLQQRLCDPRIVLSDAIDTGTYDYVDDTHIRINSLKYKYKTGTGASAVTTIVTVPQLTKDLITPWAAGDNAGALHGTAVIQNHYINVWIIRDGNGVSDYISAFSNDPPTPPAGWTVVAYAAYVYFTDKIVPFTTAIEPELFMLEFKFDTRITLGSSTINNGGPTNVIYDCSAQLTNRMHSIVLTSSSSVSQKPGTSTKYFGHANVLANGLVGLSNALYGLQPGIDLASAIGLNFQANGSARTSGSLYNSGCRLSR